MSCVPNAASFSGPSILDCPFGFYLTFIDSMETAKTQIIDGVGYVHERQRVIKLADSSQLGWKFVIEYVANPTADDSDVEKRMMRVQDRTERKNRAEKVKKGKRQKNTLRKVGRPFKSGNCFSYGKTGRWADSCRSLFVPLFVFFCLLCCLLFFDLWILITPFGIFKLFLSRIKF